MECTYVGADKPHQLLPGPYDLFALAEGDLDVPAIMLSKSVVGAAQPPANRATDTLSLRARLRHPQCGQGLGGPRAEELMERPEVSQLVLIRLDDVMASLVPPRRYISGPYPPPDRVAPHV